MRTPGLIRENRPELTSSATRTPREDGARILRMCLSSDMSPGPHWRGSDWSIRPNTVLWLADLILTLICIGSQYRQSVIRTDHHPCSVTLGPNINKAKTNHLCLLKCLLCVQSLCRSAIFALFSISLSEALSKISDVIFNCYWLGMIQNKPIQFIFANNCTVGRIHKLRVALEEVAEKRL